MSVCRENLGKKRIAIAYQNDDYGKNGVKGARRTGQIRDEAGGQIPVEKSDTDMKPHVMELKKADADVVLLWVTPVMRSASWEPARP